MSTLIFTLIAANIGYYFAFASLNPPFASMLPCALLALLLGPAACAFGCAVNEKNPRLRFLFIPLPLLSILFALLLEPGAVPLLHLAPAVIYPIVILAAGWFGVFYWDYRNHVLWSSVVLLLMMLFSQARAARPLPVIFGLGSLLLGFFTLRQLRFGAQTSPKQKLLELGALCTVPAAAFAGVFLLGKTKDVAAWLMEWVFYPLAFVLQKLVDLIDMFINLFEFSEPFPPPEIEEPEIAAEFAEGTSPIPQVQNPDEMLDSNIVTVVLIIAAILAVLAVVWIYLRMRENRRRHALLDRDEMEMIDVDAGLPRAPRDAERKSNRRKIRRIYERYLKLLRQRNFFRQPQDSSQDIAEKTRALSAKEPADELRALYILARYHPNAGITNAQVRRARQLLQLLREEPDGKT